MKNVILLRGFSKQRPPPSWGHAATITGWARPGRSPKLGTTLRLTISADSNHALVAISQDVLNKLTIKFLQQGCNQLLSPGGDACNLMLYPTTKRHLQGSKIFCIICLKQICFGHNKIWGALTTNAHQAATGMVQMPHWPHRRSAALY